MDKLKMHSKDKVKDHIAQIAALFPNAVTETIKDGKVTQAIDFEVLKQELSAVVVDGPAERYQFTWPDKRKSILLANAPIAKTLRPCREESVDFDATENLYIEGDNLDALKMLQETYLGKVKMIYIDPPYNTGNDFVYEDDFAQSAEEYLPGSGQFDETGGRLVANLDSNGRFHTDWLNMIYPRLKLAKDLLSDDGVIFISIDDNEVENLRKICDEIFGKDHFVGCFVWRRRTSSGLAEKLVSTDHEYVLAFEKGNFKSRGLPKGYSGYSNPDNDPRGDWRADNLTVGMSKDQRPNQYYILVDPVTKKEYAPNPNRVWAYIPSSMAKMIEENRIIFPSDTTKRPMVKRFKNELRIDVDPSSTWLSTVGLNSEGTRDLQEILGGNLTIYPKPVSLLTALLKAAISDSDLVLDFFSGSATTAHAIMQLNREDDGKRRFIMVQIPEKTDEKSEAYISGYKNICEIGKERIRRVGKKIKSEAGEKAKNLDTGFRVLKIDSTNMQDVYYSPGEYKQGNLLNMANNIKPDRSAEDLLFQVMLDLGIMLSSKIKEIKVGGKQVFDVADGYLLACFDHSANSDVVTEIAKRKPYYAIFRDGGIANDSLATNFEQIFATYSPTTVRKVL